MPVTIKVNGASNSLVHKGSNGVSTATIPDVCKTPSPGGPIPVPYPNVSQSATLDKGTTTVKADGGMMIATKGSEFSMSNGDNAGTLGGVKSSTFMKESTWILYSFDVKMDGQNACRLTDKKFQNHENTADMGGVIQPPVVPGPPLDVDCSAALAKCPVMSHSEQQKACKAQAAAGGPVSQSHHVIQNSHFCYPRDTPLTEICAGYSEDAAPCIALEDGTDPSTPHGRVSQMQKADATGYRQRMKDGGANPSFKEARADAKRQLTEPAPGPAMSDSDAECVMKEVDRQFKEICAKGMQNTSDFKLRPPGLRGKGLPVPGVGGGGSGAGF